MNYFSHLRSIRKTPQVALLFGSMLLGSIVVGVNSAHAVTFGSNLIVNGDAEADVGGNGGSIGPVTGWNTTGQFTVISYATGAGYPTNTDPGPASRGNNFFGGGNVSPSSGTQLITLAPGFTEIDAGGVTFDLSGFFGGYLTDNDNAALTAVFRNASNTGLGTFNIGPVLAADRGNVTGLFARSTSGTVPIGTRSISLTLDMVRTFGTSNDGYADNLSLVLNNNAATAVPEPFTVIGTLVGVTAALRLRKKLQAARK